jgi:hypothetical protein
MKDGSNRSIRFSKQGLAAIKILQAQNPHKNRDEVINDALIRMAAKAENLKPYKLSLIEEKDIILVIAAIRDLEKIHKERRDAILRAGNNQSLAKSIFIELSECEKLRRRLANLCDFTSTLTPDQVAAIVSHISTLEKQVGYANVLSVLNKLFPKEQ